MIADEVEAQFPSGYGLPLPIRVLCDFLTTNGYPISGCFEISTIGNDDIAAWFPGDIGMQRQFGVFGRGSTGSVYALWLTANMDSSTAPVIVLGSEGEFHVLAKNAFEFCRLLGCGYDELEWGDLDQPSPSFDAVKPLRDWLAKHLNVDCPATGSSIVSAAKEMYPEFSTFIRNWQH